ncbi:hypothetical protein AB6A40_004912 [Gnathostoma spinigerum]|uniref:Uncharacterized protein n=1 Tax=Gnathostoma spinigerum TaxID=75299 RepID=A0ABD6EDX6_9BILA
MHWNANYNYEPVQPTSAMDRKDGPRRSTPDTVEFYNERTRKIERENKVIYLFRYKINDENDKNEVITWYWLKKLKDDKQWRILYHPMILNFINERLIEHSFLYFLHILAYLTFLLILSSYIFDKHALQDVIATIFLLVFGFFLVVKGAIKLRNGHVSRWFICSYLFNIVTYGTTLLYIWTPQLFAYDNYNDDLKYIVAWLLPIIAIISAWLNFLYILRKSPFGIYILMMTKILHTFAQIAVIWIPTLFAFAFAFHLVMRNSGTEPWESDDLVSCCSY